MGEINFKRLLKPISLICQLGEGNLTSVFFSRIIFKRRTGVDEELL